MTTTSSKEWRFAHRHFNKNGVGARVMQGCKPVEEEDIASDLHLWFYTEQNGVERPICTDALPAPIKTMPFRTHFNLFSITARKKQVERFRDTAPMSVVFPVALLPRRMVMLRWI